MTFYYRILQCIITCCLLVITVISSNPTYATRQASACEVFGTIDLDTTWSPGQCPTYIVTGNIKILPERTLRIEPGTRIAFNAQRLMEIDGTLVARGTSAMPITFTSNLEAPAPGNWRWIQFNASSTSTTYAHDGSYMSGNVIQHAIIEYAGWRPAATNYGAIHLAGASPLIDHVTIRYNEGFGIIGGGLQLRITNNTIVANDGGMYLTTGYDQGTGLISGNTVEDNGGWGIYLTSLKALVSDNIIRGNRSCGLCLNSSTSGTPTVRNNLITENQGGGIYLSYGYPRLQSNTISNNTTPSQGAGIAISSGTPTIEYTTIISNTAGLDGGGIFINFGSRADIRHSSIIGNVARRGGGIFLNTYTTLNLTGSNVHSNTATSGSAIYNESSYDTAAQNNYWNAHTDQEIEDQIWHFADDAAVGTVYYRPYHLIQFDIMVPGHRCYLPLIRR